MAEHEPCIGQSDDWYTPRPIFDALGLTFDLESLLPVPVIGCRQGGSTPRPTTACTSRGTDWCL